VGINRGIAVHRLVYIAGIYVNISRYVVRTIMLFRYYN